MLGLTPDAMISVLGATLIGAAGVLWLLPVGSCSRCAHCRLEELAKEHQREVDSERASRAPLCPVCGRHHLPHEDHVA